MLDFLRINYIYPWITRRSARHRAVSGHSVHFSESSSLLILFTMRGNDSVKRMRALQAQFEKENKQVSFIYILMSEEYKPDVHLDEGMIKFEKHDLSFWGEVLDAEVAKVLKKDFDYMIHADLETTIYSELLLSKSAAKCRIGKMFEGKDLFYDLMIDIGSKNQPQYLLEQIYHYTKAL